MKFITQELGSPLLHNCHNGRKSTAGLLVPSIARIRGGNSNSWRQNRCPCRIFASKVARHLPSYFRVYNASFDDPEANVEQAIKHARLSNFVLRGGFHVILGSQGFYI